MKQQTFERLNETRWAQFEVALESVSQGYKLNREVDAAQFAQSYQLLSRDLGVAKARGYSRALVQRLNDLVVAGHNVVYVYRTSFLRSVLIFLVAGFPQRVRQHWRYMVAATALFMLPLVATVAMIVIAPEYVYSVMGSDEVSGLEAMYDPAAERLGRERQSDEDFLMFGFYIMNNISIAFRAYAGGISYGLLTVVTLVFNGVAIGAAGAHLWVVGYSEPFFSFVCGHGSFELTAIVISGGGGLMLGHSLIAPGNRRRWDALKEAAANSVDIVMGAAVMLLIAAFVEAFWSSMNLAPAIKYSVAVVLWLFVFAYLGLAGRRRGA